MAVGAIAADIAPGKFEEFAHGFGTGIGTELGSAYTLATEPSLAWKNLSSLSGDVKSKLESILKSLAARHQSQVGAQSHEETESSMAKLLGMFMKMQDAAKELSVHDAGHVAGAVATDAGIAKGVYETASAITKLGGQLVKIMSESEAQQAVVDLARRVATNEALKNLQEKLGSQQPKPIPPATNDSQGNGGSDEQPPEDEKDPLKKLTQAGATATVTKKVKDELKKKAGEAAAETASQASSQALREAGKKAMQDLEALAQKHASRFEKLGLKSTKSFLKHVKNEHLHGGQGAAEGKSVFSVGEDVIHLALETWEKGSQIQPGVRQHDFGRIIGTDRFGQPTSVVRSVLNKTVDGLRTAFPC